MQNNQKTIEKGRRCKLLDKSEQKIFASYITRNAKRSEIGSGSKPEDIANNDTTSHQTSDERHHSQVTHYRKG
jgi:hypothetical protein